MLTCLAGYKKYAWGADDLKPLTKEPKRPGIKSSMLMTPVDAFDTFTLLGLTASGEAKELILSRLDFNIDNDVQVFRDHHPFTGRFDHCL
ncbi:MAG: glycoside hydrolase family 47 protein [Chitinophagaceae bacterium]|nr:glycoside hydrolase family 47 protein [Chitinophagaceae bacterium]